MSQASERQAGAPLRVLLVEDDATSRNIITRLLTRSPQLMAVSSSGNLAGARQLLRRSQYDCLLLDFNLPDGTAAELLSELGRLGVAAPPAIVISGQEDRHVRELAIRAGADDYLVKGEFNHLTLHKAMSFAVQRREAIRAIWRADQQSREILSALPLQVLLLDGHAVTYLNRDLPHASQRAVLGAYIDHLLDAASRASFSEALAHVERGQGQRQLEVQIKGRRQLCQIVPLTQDPAKTVVALLDVEEARRAESALRRAEFALEEMADAAYWIDWEGRVIHANQAAERALGYSRDELQLLLIADVDPRFDDDVWVGFWHQLKREQSMRFESLHRRRDGSSFPVEVSASWLSFEDVDYVYASVRDISERRRNEATLRMLSAAIEQTSDSLIITDPRGSISYVNPAFERITGYTSAEALGQNPRLLKSDEHDPQFYAGLWQTIARGETFQSTMVNRRKDGTLYQEEVRISPVRDPSGVTHYYIATGRDITERVQLEEQLRQAQKMEAAGRLAGGIAHDFNNILTTIVNYTGFALEALPASSEVRADLTKVLRAAESATRLTNQLLSFARKRPLEAKVIEVNNTVVSIGNMLGRTLGSKIEVVVLPSDGPLHIKIDPGQLDQLLFNLAVNARDAMPNGGTLSMRLERRTPKELSGSPQPSGVVLSVSDTGCGMTPEVKARIFEPFFTTKGELGTGIGLSTCFSIVSQAGGSIDVETQVGVGTTFRITFPLAEPVNEKLSTSRARSIRGMLAFERALVVDDQPAILDAVTRTLRQLDVAVVGAHSAEEALTLLDGPAPAPEVLVTDVMLPGLSGIELARRIRARLPQLKVLLISGYLGEEASSNRASEEGMAFLPKPFTPLQLLERLNELGMTAEEPDSAPPLGQVATEARSGDRKVRPSEERIPAGEGREPVSASGRDLRVLVVDDEPAIREALRRVLSRSFAVEVARSGNEAIGKLGARQELGAIVCDLHMQDGSGVDVYRWIAQHRPELTRGLFFLSGGESSELPDDLLSEMSERLLAKPVDFSALIERLRALT